MRGFILIAVLILIAGILGIGAIMFEKAGNSYYEAVNVQYDIQGALYAATAIAAVRSLLEYDDPDFDGAEDVWAVIPTIPLAGGFVEVTVRPADDRVPVNALAASDDKVKERAKEAFTRLFSELSESDELWHALYDWVSDNASAPMSTAVRNVIFNQAGSPYTARHAPISTLYELRLVPGLSRIYGELVRRVSVGEGNIPKVNINFADNLTISAYLEELAPYTERILSAREDGAFTSKDDIFTLTNDRDAYNAALPYFDVKSTLFYVRIEASMGEEARVYHALLRRSGKRARVIRYIEGGNTTYF